ncbi:hypothetical protein P691DRAFT_508783 [Macrolepiota fuliginosa MF-IS2]|uniref:Uncharacterized protein n=1 Tax=Macrolepiota fuliginosa MF-IS2 TaxID=1400762 RepID=A0A9P6C3F4_9AGAR|nr:hypothetical protein P691DRAFT_508783 [Macrolepiota fuliginosa MF-IS2]
MNVMTEEEQIHEEGEGDQEEEQEVEEAVELGDSDDSDGNGADREGRDAETEQETQRENDDSKHSVGEADDETVTVGEVQEEREEGDPISAEDIDIEGAESYIQKCFGLRTFLPQIISQCLAVNSGPPALGSNIIKFVLSDGDNWLFGLVDCGEGPGNRICHTTAISATRLPDTGNSDEQVKRAVINVMKLLTFWATVPGQELLHLFPSE